MATSEREYGYLNAAITNMLKYHGNIENDIERVLHFYFLQCSIGMSCRELARSFLPFADHTRPFSFDGIELTTSQVKRINAIMQTCGSMMKLGNSLIWWGYPGKAVLVAVLQLSAHVSMR